MPFTVLEVAWDDPRAVALRAAMTQEMSDRYQDPAQPEAPEFAAKREAALAVTPDVVVATVLVLDGDLPVGHAALRRREGAVEVKRVVTARSHRGRGIGRLLMAEMERVALEHGETRIVLQTGEKQPEAIGLYEKLGYSPIPVLEPYRETMPHSLCYEKLLAVPSQLSA